MAESSSSQNLPSTSRQPSQNLPSTSRQPSQNLPSTSRQSSQNLPSTSRQPSQNLPSTSRQSSQNLPSTSRQPSQNLPSTSRQPSHEKICLETHTWHAKHFRMIDKLGYKIPYYSNESLNIRASYEAITENCLLQDISYYTCIEVVGEKDWLKATLKEHCDPKKTFAEKIYINDQKEGTVMFFKKNGYPQFPIGNVNFFWRPSQTNIKTIWIWVHPAFYSDFLSEIISSFEFKQNKAEQDRTDTSHNLNNFYNDAGCEMRVLKLNRFRLSGPAALTVLKDALHVPSLTELDLDSKNCPMTEEQDGWLSDEELDTSTDSNVSEQLVEKMVIDENEIDTKDLTIQDPKEKIWPTEYYKERKNIEAFKIQELMWLLMKILGSPRFLPSNMIIGLTVLDPRFNLEVRRSKTEIPSSAENLYSQLPIDLSRSPIWDAQIRQIVSNSCVSTNFNNDAKIPILLIQKPAVASLDLGSRIDIIIPSGWAMAFWDALITQSALVGGLRETKLIIFESLGTYVPDINDPDTPAYLREALKRKKKLTNRYSSHSRFPRVNFIKFGIHSPFFCDWKNLTKGWSDVEDFYVLRDFRLLALLRTEIKTIERNNAESESTVQEAEFDFQEFDEYQNCLVQVKLSMMDEETPKEFAIICLPKRKDLRRFENNKNYDETIKKILDSRLRLMLELEGLQQFLSRYKEEFLKQKKTLRDNVSPVKFAVNKLSKRRKMKWCRAKEMRKLYLPESTEVRHSCGREVMGYVTMGDYSFFRTKNIGIGYVALPSLLQIIRQKSNIVLVRNNKERQYRFARLKILVDKSVDAS